MSSLARFLSSFILCLWLQIVCGEITDCLDWKRLGTKSGVYTVYPRDRKDPIDVYCDQETDGGGWLVLQRRQDGSVNFYRNWEIYRVGFGNLSGEFWLGNENMHRLTHQRPYQLRVDLEDFENNKRYAVFDYFEVGPATDYYRLSISGYSGNAGNSFAQHNGMRFSAKNVDKDTYGKNCANLYKGAFWYNQCFHANLNGEYLRGKTITVSRGVIWTSFKGNRYSLKMTEMKIRPMKFVTQ